jgi:hypothetical protein
MVVAWTFAEAVVSPTVAATAATRSASPAARHLVIFMRRVPPLSGHVFALPEACLKRLS